MHHNKHAFHDVFQFESICSNLSQNPYSKFISIVRIKSVVVIGFKVNEEQTYLAATRYVYFFMYADFMYFLFAFICRK